MRGNLALKEVEIEGFFDAEPNANFKKLSPSKIEALILEHREHGRRLAWSFLTTWRIRLKQDEVISVVGAALCEAANRFDDTRGVAFKTFFFYHLRGMLLKEISRMIQEQRVLQYLPNHVLSEGAQSDPSYFAPSHVVPTDNNNPEKLMERKQVAELTWQACAQLDELEQEVIVRHFVNDQPLIDIAAELNYCRCHISRVKSRGLIKLQKYLSSAFSKKETALQDSAADKLLRSYTGGRGRRRISGESKQGLRLKKAA